MIRAYLKLHNPYGLIKFMEKDIPILIPLNYPYYFCRSWYSFVPLSLLLLFSTCMSFHVSFFLFQISFLKIKHASDHNIQLHEFSLSSLNISKFKTKKYQQKNPSSPKYLDPCWFTWGKRDFLFASLSSVYEAH